MSLENEELVRITAAGTISIPIRFRKFLELQKGEYVKVIMSGNHLLVKKITIS